MFQPGDMDKNNKFKNALSDAGILKMGIEVELLAVTKKNQTTVNYQFKVTNRDSEDIYVPDPNKMGNSYFHYYTNGVSFQKGDNYYWPSGFETKESDNIKSLWLAKLSPGESITRTASIKGFNAWPTGKVKARFSFPGAHLKESGAWRKGKGRIWLGSYVAEAELTLR